MDEAIKKLGILREKIKYMKQSKKKALLIKDYYNIVAFLYNAGYISSMGEYDFDIEDDDLLYEKYYQKNVNAFVNDIMKNIPLLKKQFQQLIDYYHQKLFKSITDYRKINVESNKLRGIFSSFFWNISDEALILFNRMVNEKRIVQNDNCPSEGVAINTMNSDFGYVVVGNRSDDLEYYISIVHEMGHIYMMYKRRLYPTFVNVEITSEVVSLLFEKLFFYFLEINDYLNDENIASQELHHTSIFNKLVLSVLIMTLKEKKQIREIDNDLLTIYPKISFNFLNEIISSDTPLRLEREDDLNLAILTYPIGEIISNYFFFKIIENHDLGMVELDNFLLDSVKMDLNELINKYMLDLKDSYKYIDLFMQKRKSYQKKIQY